MSVEEVLRLSFVILSVFAAKEGANVLRVDRTGVRHFDDQLILGKDLFHLSDLFPDLLFRRERVIQLTTDIDTRADQLFQLCQDFETILELSACIRLRIVEESAVDDLRVRGQVGDQVFHGRDLERVRRVRGIQYVGRSAHAVLHEGDVSLQIDLQAAVCSQHHLLTEAGRCDTVFDVDCFDDVFEFFRYSDVFDEVLHLIELADGNLDILNTIKLLCICIRCYLQLSTGDQRLQGALHFIFFYYTVEHLCLSFGFVWVSFDSTHDTRILMWYIRQIGTPVPLHAKAGQTADGFPFLLYEANCTGLSSVLSNKGTKKERVTRTRKGWKLWH